MISVHAVCISLKLWRALLRHECLSDCLKTAGICPAQQHSSWAVFATLIGQWKDSCGMYLVQVQNGKGFLCPQLILFSLVTVVGFTKYLYTAVHNFCYEKTNWRKDKSHKKIAGIMPSCFSSCLTEWLLCKLTAGSTWCTGWLISWKILSHFN